MGAVEVDEFLNSPAVGPQVSTSTRKQAKAVRAVAHKLARLICAMPSKGGEHTDRGQVNYEERCRPRVVVKLSRRAQRLGMQVVPIATPA